VIGAGIGVGAISIASGSPSGGSSYTPTERFSGTDGTFGAESAVAIDANAVNRKTVSLGSFNSSHGQGTIPIGRFLTINNVNLNTNFGIRLIEDNTTPYCWVNVANYAFAANLPAPSLTAAYLYGPVGGVDRYEATNIGFIDWVGNFRLRDHGQAGSGQGYVIDEFADSRTNPSGTMQNGVVSQRYDGRMSYVTSVTAGNKMRGTGWEIADVVPTSWDWLGGATNYANLVAGTGFSKIGNITGAEIKYDFATALEPRTYSLDITRSDSGSSTVRVATRQSNGANRNVTWSGGTRNGQTISYNDISRTDTVSFTNTLPVDQIALQLIYDGPVVTGISVIG